MRGGLEKEEEEEDGSGREMGSEGKGGDGWEAKKMRGKCKRMR